MSFIKRSACVVSMTALLSQSAIAANFEQLLCKHRKKVAIVGGGVTGLTIAKFLQRQGYSDVTVFEKESEVGGKVKSLTFGGKNYDTGAVLATTGFKEILEEAENHNVPVKEFQKDFEIVYGDKKNTVGGFLAENYSEGELNKALLRFATLIALNPKIATQGPEWTPIRTFNVI